jgi:hypothetical protein
MQPLLTADDLPQRAEGYRRQLRRAAQRRLVETLRSQGERILERSGGWVTLTRFERGDCYHVGPDGQLRIGNWARDRSISAPWIARKLLAA